jgi:hypothetical protein
MGKKFQKNILNLGSSYLTLMPNILQLLKVSPYECASAIIVGFCFIVLGATCGSGHDDLLDTMFAGVFIFVVLTLVSALLLLGSQLLYSICVGEDGAAFRRMVIFEFITTITYNVRVFICWLRYVVYDLQVEFIDMSLHYSEELDFCCVSTQCNYYQSVLVGIADYCLVGIQIILSLGKLAIAAALL